jgi:hypothetical protein
MDEALQAALGRIEEKRTAYEEGSKRLKFDYLDEVVQAKNAASALLVADGMGVTRHRIYQILKERDTLAEELGIPVLG